MEQSLKRIFKKFGGVIRTSQLNQEGFYYKKIQELLANNQIEQIRQGYYQYIGANSFSDIPTYCNAISRWNALHEDCSRLLWIYE